MKAGALENHLDVDVLWSHLWTRIEEQFMRKELLHGVIPENYLRKGILLKKYSYDKRLLVNTDLVLWLKDVLLLNLDLGISLIGSSLGCIRF